jgi:hypothetical protein
VIYVAYYVEYTFLLQPQDEDVETTPSYVIIKFNSFVHANIADDIRIEGLMSHGGSYTIDNFLDDIGAKGLQFELIDPSRVIIFEELPSKQLEREEKEKKNRNEERRHEPNIYG